MLLLDKASLLRAILYVCVSVHSSYNFTCDNAYKTPLSKFSVISLSRLRALSNIGSPYIYALCLLFSTSFCHRHQFLLERGFAVLERSPCPMKELRS